jgi:hypothetical protein
MARGLDAALSWAKAAAAKHTQASISAVIEASVAKRLFISDLLSCFELRQRNSQPALNGMFLSGPECDVAAGHSRGHAIFNAVLLEVNRKVTNARRR